MKKLLIILSFVSIFACNSTDETETGNAVVKKEMVKSDENLVPNIIDENNVESDKAVQSISGLWKTYKASKTLAEENYSKGEFASMIQNYEISANAAIDLSREDLAAQQLNNIGYFSIEEFKKNTQYEERVQQLAIETDQIRRDSIFEETKRIFNKNYQLLLDSEPHLNKAYRLDKKYKMSNRTKAIVENLKFIKWIRQFLQTISAKSMEK